MSRHLSSSNSAKAELRRFSLRPKKKLKNAPGGVDDDEHQEEQSLEGDGNSKVRSKSNTSVTKNLKTDESTSCLDNTVPKKGIKRKKPIKVKFSGESSNAENEGWFPENWEKVLANIREMRKDREAPVDTMGCDQCKDAGESPEVQRYHTLISLMLSSQTKDEVTFAAMQRLKAHGLTVDKVLEMSDKNLGDLIYPVGFWKSKVNFIKKTTKILKEEYNSDIPDTVESLCSLPGVGPKMAYLAMNIGWGVVTGIGVDTHVHRISNRLGWVRKKTKTPEETRLALESWLPKDLWSEVNHMLVGFGQTICKPVSPDCSGCKNSTICPSSSVKKK